nr:unnamed protein product [Callosobruchus analis]
MPRNYMKKRKNYSDQDVADAETEIREGKSSIRGAAKKFKINATYEYLYRRLHNLHQGVQGRRTALSQSDEEALANSVKIMAKWGFPLTKDELKNVVCDYVTANGLKTVFKNNKPGNDWFASFCNRHRLSLKTPENLETVRRNATKDPFIIYDFYDLLETEIEKLGLQDKPNHIFNLDETYFTFDPSRTKAVGAKGEKFHRNIQGSGKENITVLGNVSADGQLLPPLFVFQASNLWSSWKGNNDLPNTFYACSEKGWMTAQIFQGYFYKFCAFVKQRPVLLIFDGHLSHLDVGTIKKAKAENITIIKLPAHTTDLLQPLDTCCFRPLKNLWDKELVSWQRENQRKLSKSEFVDLLCKIWHEGITPQTFLTGFRSTDIYPPNRNKYPISRIDPEKLQRYEENKRMSNRCAPCPSSQPQQEAMLLDTSQPGTSNFMVPSQNTEPGTDLASSSTSDPQTNTLQNINSVVQQNQLQATISFESLLLDKVNKHPKPVPPARRKIDGKGKVITAQEYLDAIKAKVDSKINKVSKKSKENKPPNGNHGSPKINRCKQISKTKFRGGKRSSFIYRYVCSVLNICDSGEIKVMGLISTSTDKDKFRKVVSDVSYITKEDVIGKLPLPDVADDIYTFCAPVDIHEQK